MTQPINLSRGLEAWYDLGSAYYDSQQNRMQDKSGYGLQVEAEGGPTVGVAGPGEFEATQMDDVDDQFVADDFIVGDSTLSFFTLLKIDAVDDDSIPAIFGNDGLTGNGVVLYISNADDSIGEGSFELRYYNDGEHNGARSATQTPITDQWIPVVGSVTDNEVRLEAFDEVVTTSKEVPWGTPDENMSLNNWYSGAARHTEQTMAVSAFWSRELNIPEREYLKNITGPQRSML